jgi:gliding motility-associated-like protein
VKKVLSLFFLISWFLSANGQELAVDFSFDTVCFGSMTRFQSLCVITDTVSPPRDSIISLSWDLNGDGKFDDGEGPKDSIVFNEAGLFSVGLKAVTLLGVAKSRYKLVPCNKVTASFLFNAGCVLEPVQFSNKSTVLGSNEITYFWSFGDGTTAQGIKDPTHSYTSPANYTVKLLARFRTPKPLGCPDSVSKVITVKASPVLQLSFSGDTVMYLGDTLFVSLVGKYDSIRWSTGSVNQTIMILKGGYYWVRGYSGSCYGQDGFTVTIKEKGKEPVISNLFTPNGDGYNDRWTILNLNQFSPCDVSVYDRYGLKVFSSSSYQNDWDGTFNGKALQNDTYYYFLRCKDNVLYKGNVSILK